MSNKALDLFDPSCKDDGAKWYACEATASNRSPFIGCCKTDPCSIGGCTVGNLAPVSFNGSAYDLVGNQLPEPSCDSASTFYTCVNLPKNDTTFFGCCKTGNNPCNTTDKQCAKDDLTAAVLENQNQQSGWSANGTTSSPEKEVGQSHTGVIVGAAVGGGVAVVAIIAILIYCLFKKRRERSTRASMSSATSFAALEKTSYRNSALSEAPPESLYNSPKPPPFAAFGGQHQYQQVAQTSNEPVEMPGDFATEGGRQRYSELPAEATSSQLKQPPVEMESPMMSPYQSPRLSSRMPNSPLS